MRALPLSGATAPGTFTGMTTLTSPMFVGFALLLLSPCAPLACLTYWAPHMGMHPTSVHLHYPLTCSCVHFHRQVHLHWALACLTYWAPHMGMHPTSLHLHYPLLVHACTSTVRCNCTGHFCGNDNSYISHVCRVCASVFYLLGHHLLACLLILGTA